MAVLFYQKLHHHAPVLFGVEAQGVLDAVAGEVVHDDGGAVLPVFGVDQGELGLVPLEELVDALLVGVGFGGRHEVLGVQPGKGAAGAAQAEQYRQCEKQRAARHGKAPFPDK